jgi:polyisoprenoid-binding protein YceI
MRIAMRITRLTCVSAAAVSTLALLPALLCAQDAYRVTSGEVSVLCPLTIGGSFEAKTQALSGEVTAAPAGGAVKGVMSVDLMKLRTGISLRDRHLRNNYLEVQRGADFAVAKLENIRVERAPGKTTFRGTLRVHGQQREISGTADVTPDGKGYRLAASFPVRVSEFQIPEPSYLGVGVQDEVTVRVNFNAVPAAAAAAASQAGNN